MTLSWPSSRLLCHHQTMLSLRPKRRGRAFWLVMTQQLYPFLLCLTKLCTVSAVSNSLLRESSIRAVWNETNLGFCPFSMPLLNFVKTHTTLPPPHGQAPSPILYIVRHAIQHNITFRYSCPQHHHAQKGCTLTSVHLPQSQLCR